MKYERNGSTGQIVHQGHIQTAEAGGYVALIGADVNNQGTITTSQGAVVLAAADAVTLPSVSAINNVSVPLSRNVRLELNPDSFGSASVSNSGVIVTDGGQVLMRAAAVVDAVSKVANATVVQSGSIDTTGAQGGGVNILADNGRIRVSGSVKANSTDGSAGGDVYIGRDKDTNVLAAVGDVRDAKLESKGGFVETSGQYLATNGVSVKAKDWLLDPTDITIVKVGTLTPDTDSSLVAGTTTYIDTIGRSTSEVLTGTIETAINNGTNVIISTTNTTSGANGSGNITIFDKLDFANNSGQDATLTLLAKNGIEQKAGATIIQTAGANNNKVNVVMTSEGWHMGVLGSSASSRGITLNAAINTNGDVTLNGTTNNSGAASASNAIGVDIKSTAAINAKNISITGKSESSFGIQSVSALSATDKITLDGTSKNWVGVVTNGAVTAGGALTIIGRKTTAAGYQGVNVSSAVKGASVAITGNTIGHYGVAVGPSGSVESTVGDVTIVGTGTGNTSMGAGNQTNGVRLDGAVTAKNKLSITGTVNGAGGYQGVLVYKALKGNSIDIKGTSNAWDAIHFANNGSVTSATTLVIDGDSSAVGKGILFSGTGVFTADSYLVKAKTAVNNGIYFGGTTTFNSSSTSTDSLIDVTRTTAGGETIYNAGTLTINSGAGKATLQTSTANVGGGIRINGGSTVNTNGDVTIGSKNSSNAYTMHQGTINAQGNLKLLGQVNSATRVNSDPGVNAGVWLQDSGGVVAKIFGTNGANITIDGTNTSRDAGVNLSVNNSANIISTTGTTISGAVGNISITGTSTSGTGIANAAATISNDSGNTGNKGNVTLVGKSNGGDHWGITSTGQITAAGLVKMTGTAVGIRAGVSVGAKVEGGSVDIYGSSTKGVGVEIAAIVKSTDTPATSPGVTLTGFGGNGGGDNQGVLVRAAGSVDSASKVSIVGTNAVAVGSSTLMGTLIQGTVKAAGDINLEGYSTNASSPNHGLVINNTVTSTGGNIKATASAANAEKVALSISGAGALIASGSNKNITMVANTMDFSGATAINAGTTGTVNITTKDKATSNAIRIGVEDTSGIPAVAGPWLSLNQTELNKITAAKTVIGDSLNTGGISVDGAVTTATAAGNITLHTTGNIKVNQALTIATGKTLTLNGAGASSTISQANTNAGITADQVEFLGNNATVTLQPTATTSPSANKIGAIAGNVKSFALTNQRDLTVGVVNGTTGLTATNDIKLTTTTATGTALNIEKKIESADGDVIINATTSETFVPLLGRFAAVKSSSEVNGKNITMNAVALGTTGKTLGYYGATGPTPRSGFFTAANNLSLKGSTQNEGNGFYMWRGALSAGNTLSIEGTSKLGQGVGFDGPSTTATNVSIESGNGVTIKGNALTAGQVGINLNGVDLKNNVVGAIRNASAVTLEALNGDITTFGTGTLTQSGNGGVKLTTVSDGNIFVPKIINNGTGNVVIAAGSDLLAGNGGGGQVKTVLGNTISQTNTTPGNTYIYSGSAANTGLLSHLDSSFSELRLSGDMGEAQNADSNVKYAAGTTITGGAKAQVMFREKIALNTSTITGASLDKTYGDANTKNNSTDQTALFAEMQAQLKQTNPGQIITRSLDVTNGTNGAGEFKISKAALINDFSGSLNTDATSFSNSTHLTAKTHEYGELSSTKYSATLAAGKAKVEVAKKAITLSGATASDKVYDQTDTATLTNVGGLTDGAANKDDKKKFADDVVTVTVTNAKFSDALVGDNKPVTVGASLTGGDADNYTFVTPANLTARITGAVEPVDPPGPVVPVPAPAPSNNTVVVAGGNNSFQLAGAEAACSADTLNQCECETATNPEGVALEGIQICYEPNTPPSSAL
jgi:hypothetical protein